MRLQLRNNVHWCDCAGRAIFLDIEADRYFCLPATANAAFLRLVAGNIHRGDAEQLRAMVARRLLIEDCALAAIRPPPLIEPPSHDWLIEPSPRAGLFPILQALVSEMSAARLLRTRPFLEVLDAARRQGSKDDRPPRHEQHLLRIIVGVSSAASYLVRVQDRCLVRALAVHSICRKRGLRPKLVFGVIAHPFAAHCWVQLGSAVLVGGFEQARLYTPILVLE